ncbi:Ubiquitin carboxyl-terminal hydrolase 47 [Strongyloides ratti]|uniref:Ubiquitin carboxyl-terminal hydrolase 47 n=1 Tax=Strongyloides ratti TaxID=34506 RepID=A0A090LLP6_STRRB|nr:Ubiquitin carboxyl-terminal hydrolase 47 [Strongyloides ratti]CEF68480.1 Ubiquitin carboxyl-terminal hydrolase 47 [Strongyloides ratti]
MDDDINSRFSRVFREEGFGFRGLLDVRRPLRTNLSYHEENQNFNQEGDLNSSSELPCHEPSSSSEGGPSTDLPTYEEVINAGQPPNYEEATRTAESPDFEMDVSDENGHAYVGLVNQAMTCYLNSLIQSLYMTPEFRNAVFAWKSSDLSLIDQGKSIAFQLQKLFLLLLTSDQRALETKDLTASFGWNSNEAYDQHDVQEFCHIMFDALEHTWRKSNHKDLISKFYRGKIEDYVKCLNCKNERIKEDLFLDIPLTIKKFGSNDSFTSVEQCLREFTSPEILKGNNKYQCEQCKSKQDAIKGLRYKKFPYILSMQLKRFDFNYENCSRIKLNDKVTFPDYLDLNFLIGDDNEIDDKDIIKLKSSTEDDSNVCSKTGNNSNKNNSTSNDFAYCEPDERDEKVKKLLENGQYVYELFSVMVHQGNASGGHYFAYIKNMELNRWFCFNDSLVTVASFQNIYDTFGTTTFRWGVNHSNAYMLMYRRVDPELNEKFTKPCELPSHLLELQKKLLEEDRYLAEQQRIQDSLVTCQVKLNLIRPPSFQKDNDIIPFQLTYQPDTPLKYIHENLVENFPRFFGKSIGQSYHCNLKNSRLLLCKSHQFDIMPYPDGVNVNENVLSDVNPEVLNTDAHHRPEVFFLLDIIWEGYTDFLSYDFELHPNEFGVTLCLCLVDLDKDCRLSKLCQLDFAQKFYILGSVTVGELKRRISALLRLSFNDFEEQNGMRLIAEFCKDKFYESVYMQLNDTMTMKDIYSHYNYDQPCQPIIYADCKNFSQDTINDRMKPIEESRYSKVLSRKKFGHYVTVHFPNSKERKRFGLSDFHDSIAFREDITDSSSSINYLPMDSKDLTEGLLSDIDNSSNPSLRSDDMSSAGNNSANRSPVVSDCERDSSSEESPRYQEFEDDFNLMTEDFPLEINNDRIWNTEDIPSSNNVQLSIDNFSYSQKPISCSDSCFVEVIHENLAASNAIFLIDRRGKIRDICARLARYFEIPLQNFKLNRATRDHGGLHYTNYPISVDNVNNIGNILDNGDDLSITLKLNLNTGEESVSFYFIHLSRDTIQTCNIYCDIALSKNDTYKGAKDKLLRNIYHIDGLAFDGDKLRLLQFKDERFSKVTSISDFLESAFANKIPLCIYVNIFEDSDIDSIDANKKDWHFIYARRWLPSSSSFSDLINVPIPPYQNENSHNESIQYDKFGSGFHSSGDEGSFDPSAKRRKPSHFYEELDPSYVQFVESQLSNFLCNRDGIKPSDLEFTKIFPFNATDKWPFNIGKLSFIDQQVEFYSKLVFKKNIKNFDGCVVYFRDASEQPAEICPDRRKELYIEEKRHANSNINVSRRIERPLRIKISTSISEN